MGTNNNNNDERKSNRQKYAEEGCLNAAFTQNSWFIKIKPAYDIDKVIFCFVQKGSSGKSSFNVYMDLDLFDLWMDDVLSYRLSRIIENEKNAGEIYPKFYKAVTGEKGAYTVGICASSKLPGMFVINGTGKHKDKGVQVGNTLVGNVPVDYNWLRVTAKYYQRTCKSRFENLSNTILTESRAHHNPAEGVVSGDNFAEQEDSNVDTSTSSKPSSSGNSNKITNSETRSSSNKDSSPKQQNNTSSQPKSSTEKKPLPAIHYKDKNDKQMTVDSNTKICYDGMHYRLQVLDQEGTLQNVIITNDVAKELGNRLSELRKACEITYDEKKHTHFTMLYKAGTYIDADVLFLTGIISE